MLNIIPRHKQLTLKRRAAAQLTSIENILLQQVHCKPRLVFRIMNEKPFHSSDYRTGFRSWAPAPGGRQEMFNSANNITIYGGTFNTGTTFENGMATV